MNWHIQCICLVDHDNWNEVMSSLSVAKNVKLDVFYHNETSSLCYYVSNYRPLIQKEMNGFLQTEIKTWVKKINQETNDKKMFVLYCHTNGWYFRHNDKILGFNYIMDCIKPYYYDIFYLMSCYVSTLEVLYECKNNCQYFIGSEIDRYNGFSFQPSLIDFNKNEKDVALQMVKTNIDYFNIEKEIGDIVCIDCNKIDLLYSFIQSYPLTNCGIESYIVSKIKPLRKYNNCCYDILSFYNDCLDKETYKIFEKIWNQVVLMYSQSDKCKEKKSSRRCNGIAWCPVPWDSEHGWTYKYMKCYGKECQYWLYEKPIENFRL